MMPALKNIRELQLKPKHYGWVQGLYLAGNDCGIAMRLLDGQDYEPESRKLWRSLCKDAKIAIDVGAHTGIYSLDGWKAGAKEVLSFEPYHINYARLVMNLRYSGIDATYSMFCALSDINGITAVVVRAPNHYCSAGAHLGYDPLVGHKTHDSGEFPVYVRTLDSLIAEEHRSGIKVVKIDTEGHGLRVLKGMSEILLHQPDLILECIEEGMGEFLKPFGYKFYRIHEKTGLHAVDRLLPDNPVDMQSPNRFATVRSL